MQHSTRAAYTLSRNSKLNKNARHNAGTNFLELGGYMQLLVKCSSWPGLWASGLILTDKKGIEPIARATQQRA